MVSTQSNSIQSRLHSFLQKLKGRSPQTDLTIQVEAFPTETQKFHKLVLQVSGPVFQFDIHADGEDLDAVLERLEGTFADELAQRRAALYMNLEEIETSSPLYSRYLH